MPIIKMVIVVWTFQNEKLQSNHYRFENLSKKSTKIASNQHTVRLDKVNSLIF
jgi:hypothetical protein